MMYAIELKKLTKIYKGGLQALKNINLNVKIGDFYALLGYNGAGKSTFIGIISTLISKSSGKITVFGLDADKNITNIKRNLGIVPQEFNFNPFETVYQILIYQAGYYGIKYKFAMIRAKKLLIKLDLWDKRNIRARMLSVGMKRRLMIARALIHEPKLLILDEPTTGVDVEMRRYIWNFLRDLNKNGTTIILTTHYLEEAEILCKNIGIIQSGELIENTSMQELLSKLKSETFLLNLSKKNISPKLVGYRNNLIDENTLEVEVTRKKGLNDLFKQLSDQEIQILSMRNKVNRLEELFVKLVSRNKFKDNKI